MELAHLKEFTILADTLNYTEAAELLYISQPVLSKHIRSMENELGAKLFERNSRRVMLTEFGKQYLDKIIGIVTQYDDVEKWCKEYAKDYDMTIHIGIPESPELYEVKEHFRIFSRLYPEYKIETHEMPSNILFRKFEDGAFNMVLTGMTSDVDISSITFEYIEAAKGRIKVCLNSEHPLADKGYLTFPDLTNERVILPPYDSVFQQFIEKEFMKACSAKKEFLYGSYSLAKMLAQSGSCIALLQEEALRDPMTDNLIVLDLEPAISYSRGLGYRLHSLNNAEQAYLSFAREQLESNKPGSR